MKKQKLKNIHFKTFFSSILKGFFLTFLLLFSGFVQPMFGQNSSPCSTIQVIDVADDPENTGGALLQGILVSNPTTPNQAVRIYNENWELIAECNSAECGNPYTFPTPAGKYFVQVQLFMEDDLSLIHISEPTRPY